jgi:hypothetical protein
MPETAPMKDKARSLTGNFKARALQQIPAERAANYDFEIPPAHKSNALPFERDHLGATRRIAFDDA